MAGDAPEAPGPLEGPRRWREQRWVVDEAIRTNGIEWDQPRLGYTLGPVGGEQAPGEAALLRSQIRKVADFVPAVSALAARRERLALQAEDAGHGMTAGEHWYAAALLWSLATWPIWRSTDELLEIDERKNRAYLAWARHASHHVERVDVAFGPHSLPAWFHLPPGHRPGDAVPTVLACGGMDAGREIIVRREGDPLLARGLAVLAFDGPGQGEAPLRGLHVSATNWIDAGQALLSWCHQRPEIDTGRLMALGTSFGSFWVMQIAATQPSLKGCVAALPIFEPGCATIFGSAAPTFKARHMFMAGLFDNEDAFDRMVADYDLRPLVDGMEVPWLSVAGGADELSPVSWVYELARRSAAPSSLLVYERARHGLTESPAAVLGPPWQATIGDWLLDRARSIPARHELRLVKVNGTVEERPHPGAA